MDQYHSFSSAVNNNDDFVNVLIKYKYISSTNVEKTFRSVDRGFYYKDEDKPHAYDGSLNLLCDPCVYATALESLKLCSGHSFLNIGSGIGYFSTMAGILLGRNGVNHGIEIDKKLIDFAIEKLAEFKLNSAAIDHHDFCEPIFIQGNACELLPTGYYDRVFCGAAVPPEEFEFMKSLIKIGGILVMVLEGALLKVIRQDEHLWYTTELLNEIFEDSFPLLLVPEPCSLKIVTFPSVKPLTLQELCRSNIRSFMRQHLQKENSELKIYTECVSLNSNAFKQFVCEKKDEVVEQVNLQDIENVSSDESSVIDIDNFLDSAKISDDEEESDPSLQCPLKRVTNIQPTCVWTHGIYGPLDTTDESENDSEADSDLKNNYFISDYRLNELSKRLKENIYSLSIPTPLKHFLNYYRID
ncbi:S-adenosyl-L-methionine-dependent methyltransferase [Cinara cedri]|uniref:S-adenosyl-L-methionine-dependent methyltransferase n=1 Tax=Cinara cedri TaxID=506608 RepID=A0A5E4NKM6_9HEMI|nr:S-adenosyl-L-methionine-dependent methyltransferase [Cinara cedri]